MKTEISYYEYRERGGTNVNLTADPRTPEELEKLLTELRGPQKAPPPGENGPPIEPPIQPPRPLNPFFDLGKAVGKVGEVVQIPVVGGSRKPVDGFHIGGGCGLYPGVERSGYKKLKATAVVLGDFLTKYLKAQNIRETVFEKFQMVTWDEHKALPEEWWEYALGFFSLTEERTVPPVSIPHGTELFKVSFEILPQDPGELTLTCIDEHYYTQTVRRRRDWTYTGAGQGQTRVELNGGEVKVTP